MLKAFPWLPMAPGERTVPGMLQAQAARFGAKPLFSCLGERWTFADAPEIAARMAGTLQTAGIAAGDRVAILSSNRPEVMRVLLGCGWLGAIAVPLNTASQARQLRYYLENSAARLLVIEMELLAAMDAAVFAGLALERIWLVGGSASAQGLGLPVSPLPEPGPALPAASMRPGDTFAILYTSGTTGPAKGVCCPHAQFYWWGINTAGFLGVRGGDVLATALPLFHTNAINTFFQALLTGSQQAVLPKFSASGFWPAMAEAGATIGYLLGAMVPILLAQPPTAAERAHSMRAALGPGVPAALHAEFLRRTGVALADGFGSTETNFVIGTTAGDRIPGKIGCLTQGVSAKVVADDGAEAMPGMPGELLLRADDPLAFSSGYFGDPEKTAEAWQGGWFRTGDRVIRHGDGQFSFVDRLKDVIRRRGENISSLEVEQVLAAHPAVETAAVFPVPSDLAEDEVMAAVVLRLETPASVEDLFRHCAKELPRFSVPRYLELCQELPRTENGKVQKFKLRERGVTAQTVDRLKLQRVP